VIGDGWESTLASSYWENTYWIWGAGQMNGVQINFRGDRIDFAPVPLPAAAWFMLSGLGVVACASRRRRLQK